MAQISYVYDDGTGRTVEVSLGGAMTSAADPKIVHNA
jgi:hypothetical protein